MELSVARTPLLPRREAEALWSYKLFAKHFGLTIPKVLGLFEALGLRGPTKEPTPLAMFLELAHGQVIEDKHTGQSVMWYRWYRDRTLAHMEKQPAAAALFQKAKKQVRESGMRRSEAKKIVSNACFLLQSSFGPKNLKALGLDEDSPDGLSADGRISYLSAALAVSLTNMDHHVSDGFCDWGMDPEGEDLDAFRTIAMEAVIVARLCEALPLSETARRRVQEVSERIVEACITMCKVQAGFVPLIRGRVEYWSRAALANVVLGEQPYEGLGDPESSP